MMRRISVVMAVRDGARYLAGAIDSVLADTLTAEFVVVDDGSTDATAEIVARYGDRLRVLHQPPLGQMTALNRGIAAATGDLLSFQDADDIWPPGRLTALAAALTDGVDGVYGRVEQFFSPDLPAHEAARIRMSPDPASMCAFGTLLVRARAVRAVGPIDETLATSANIDWASRADAAGLRLAAIDDTVLRRRIHAANLGRRVARDSRNADLLRVMRSHLARKRESA